MRSHISIDILRLSIDMCGDDGIVVVVHCLYILRCSETQRSGDVSRRLQEVSDAAQSASGTFDLLAKAGKGHGDRP